MKGPGRAGIPRSTMAPRQPSRTVTSPLPVGAGTPFSALKGLRRDAGEGRGANAAGKLFGGAGAKNRVSHSG